MKIKLRIKLIILVKHFGQYLKDIPTIFEEKLDFCRLNNNNNYYYLIWSFCTYKYAQMVLTYLDEINSINNNLNFEWKPILLFLTCLYLKKENKGEEMSEENEINFGGLWTPKNFKIFRLKILRLLLFATIKNMSKYETEDQRLIEQWPIVLLRLIQLEKISEKYSVILDSMAINGKFNFLR
ncbi:hypothetical protein Mgra_00009389 [Meloidogyne graminicola]|uniref:Uncharacterized protein n=1 Tax=Meloidogyne graminicola TaxID=189291 RepID=A0A8S9Z7Z3_9BILA|nr:hypothetical protein Mgra_00009389 [Meloidogyne graminicola]